MRLGLVACCLALFGAGAAPAVAGPGFFTGVVDTPAVVAESGAALEDLGVGGARIWVEWPHEPERQSEPDEETVAAVQGAAAALPTGARLLVSVGSSVYTPRDEEARDRYCGYLKALLEEVPSVRDVGIWNEPNKTAGWRPQFDEDGRSVAPAEYVALLARCWDVLHAFEPAVNVVAPSTSPNGNDNPNAVSNISHSPTRFLEKMGAAYRESGRTKRIFDTLSQHAYGASARERPWVSHADVRWIAQGDWWRLRTAAQTAFAGTAQPVPGRCDALGCMWIWYTEGGFQTEPLPEKAHLYTGAENVLVIPDDVGGDPEGEPPARFAPDRRAQIVDAVRLAACQPYVQAFFNYLLVDEAPLPRWQSGFLWADGMPKGSYPYAKAGIAEAAAGEVDCAALKGGPPPAPDSAAPAASSSVVARPGRNRVRLSWSASIDTDVMGYHVERATGRRGPWVRLTGHSVGSPWVDRSARNGVRYRYAVKAVDTAGNESGRSAAACATPTAALARYAPSAVRVRTGRSGGGGVARLRAKDGKRLVLSSAARGGSQRAVLQATVPLPRCARPVARVGVRLAASASGPGVRLSVAVGDPRSGRWLGVGGGSWTAGGRERVVAAAVPARVARGSVVRLRVAAVGPEPFRARIDLLRLDVRS